MIALLSIATIALSTASSVHSIVIPRTTPPSGWLTDILEPYDTYHTRYLALDCESQHGKAFFDQCCHPLLATQKLSERPAQCIPSSNAPSSVDDKSAGDDDDCDDENDGDDSAPASEPAGKAGISSSSSAPAPPKPTTKALPPPAPAPAPAPPKPAPAPAKPAPAPPSNGGGGSGGNVFTGGFATFFFQNGVAGACGTAHSDNDLIAAIDIQRYGNTGVRSGLCGKQVSITNPANNKNVVVTIADACPGCNGQNSIDLSTGAFNRIADPSQGQVPITWSFV